MKQHQYTFMAPALPLALALSLGLSGCADNDTGESSEPVQDEASSVQGLSEKATFAQANDPLPTAPEARLGETERWFYKDDQGHGAMAIFGSPMSEGRLTLRCSAPDEITLYQAADAVPGATGELILHAGGSRKRLVARGGETQLPGYTTTMAADDSWFDTLLSANGELRVAVGEESQLVLPITDDAKRLVRTCREGG